MGATRLNYGNARARIDFLLCICAIHRVRRAWIWSSATACGSASGRMMFWAQLCWAKCRRVKWQGLRAWPIPDLHFNAFGGFAFSAHGLRSEGCGRERGFRVGGRDLVLDGFAVKGEAVDIAAQDQIIDKLTAQHGG